MKKMENFYSNQIKQIHLMFNSIFSPKKKTKKKYSIWKAEFFLVNLTKNKKKIKISLKLQNKDNKTRKEKKIQNHIKQ